MHSYSIIHWLAIEYSSWTPLNKHNHHSRIHLLA